MPWRTLTSALVATTLAATLSAQTPLPFPRPAQPSPNNPPAKPPPATPAQPVAAPQPQRAGEPTEAELAGITLYPSAQFLKSYDAGKGQRYYLYGTTATYAEIVAYYKTLLRKNGDAIFEPPAPGMHMFELARFREETMAFPPSLTVKDYSATGGYLNPRRGGQPARFPTIIQIVPAPAGSPR
jgi:hypothetical protein